MKTRKLERELSDENSFGRDTEVSFNFATGTGLLYGVAAIYFGREMGSEFLTGTGYGVLAADVLMNVAARANRISNYLRDMILPPI